MDLGLPGLTWDSSCVAGQEALLQVMLLRGRDGGGECCGHKAKGGV